MKPSYPDAESHMKFKQDDFMAVRKQRPLIHHLSNWVTLNDCANAAYAIGARPTMASDPDEAILAAQQADAAVWNLGTFNPLVSTAIQASLPYLAVRPIPVVIDPVAAQAYPGRLHFTQQCLSRFAHLATQGTLACSIFIRGNTSELDALLATDHSQAKNHGGVDFCRKWDGVPFSAKMSSYQRFFATFPANFPLYLVETGTEDRVLFWEDGELKILAHKESCLSLTRITGAGCVSNTLIAAMTGSLLLNKPGASRLDLARSALAAVASLVQAGRRAENNAAGIGTFHCFLFDELGRTGVNPEIDPESFPLGSRVPML